MNSGEEPKGVLNFKLNKYLNSESRYARFQLPPKDLYSVRNNLKERFSNPVIDNMSQVINFNNPFEPNNTRR